MKSIKFAKVIGLTLAISTAVTMLAGCGGSTDSADSTKAANDTAVAASSEAVSTTAAAEEPGWKKLELILISLCQ